MNQAQQIPPREHVLRDYLSSAGESFPVLEYLQLLWFRRRLILAITAIVGVIVLIQVNELRPLYRATSTMVIGELDAGGMMDPQQVMLMRYLGRDKTTELQVLRSRRLAEQVIDNLNLLTYEEFNPSLRAAEESFFDFLQYLDPRTWIPDSWTRGVREAVTGEVTETPPDEEAERRGPIETATNILLGKIAVAQVDYSNVITVSATSWSPRLAADIANELPEAYNIDRLQARFDATEKTTSWLTEQLEDLKVQVEESERAVERYRDEQGLVAGDAILNDQLSEINSQLIIIRSERAGAEARLAQLQRLVGSGRDNIETATEVLASPLVQQLRNQEADAMRRQSELAVEYGPKHPRMLQVNAEITDIQNRIEAEISNVVSGLQNEIEVARTKEQSLERSLREAGFQTGVQNQQEVQLRALEREATANRTLYENFLGRFKETSTTQDVEISDSRIISEAQVPGGPFYPNKQRILMTRIFFGFVAACALVFALHFLNPGLTSPEQIERELGLHTIGMIPTVPSKVSPHEYMLENPRSGFVEAINSLKVSLRLSDPDAKIKAIQVTSSVPGEGKSALVLSLAANMAREGRKVLVIDADLRRSSLEKKLGLPGEGMGLTDFVLAESLEPEKYIFHEETTGVDFMRTGDAHYANATDIFTSNRIREIIEKLKEKYDYVLIDTPPVMAVSDARVIGQISDKTLMVLRWDKTPRKVVRAALEELRKGSAEIAGIVLQQVDLKRYGRMGYGYGYSGYYYYHYGRQYYHG